MSENGWTGSKVCTGPLSFIFFTYILDIPSHHHKEILKTKQQYKITNIPSSLPKSLHKQTFFEFQSVLILTLLWLVNTLLSYDFWHLEIVNFEEEKEKSAVCFSNFDINIKVATNLFYHSFQFHDFNRRRFFSNWKKYWFLIKYAILSMVCRSKNLTSFLCKLYTDKKDSLKI